ncbi:MAG: nucleotide exchange factor GrpE [Methylobacteriaceae bacterium]|nr:nucleotide exchange factor GrpE [Methylobacteriaceae bacterium]
MQEPTRKQRDTAEALDQAPADEGANPAASPSREGVAPQGPAVEAAPSEVEALQQENAGLKDRLLRALAEMENLRRRTEREVADAKTYGVSNFARDMLGVADNLRRALDHLPAQARESADPAIRSLIEGVEVTERDFLSRLTRHGVKKLDPQGERFDPNLHEALFEVPDESVPAGTVVQVVESGYTIGDRVLRPAKVGVSKGGPKV